MKSLYNNEAIKMRDYSIEEFVEHYTVTRVVSEEAISDYLYKVKDVLSSLYNKTFNGDIDALAVDAVKQRFESEHVTKRLEWSKVSVYTVGKPDGFIGKYLPYTNDLTEMARLTSDSALLVLNQIKVTVGSFINNGVNTGVLEGSSVFREVKRNNDLIQKTLSKYFNSSNHATKVEIRKLLNNLNDVKLINENVTKLGGTIDKTKADEISRLTQEAADYVDMLINQENINSMLTRNNNIKTDLVNAVAIASKAVELYGYVYGQLLFLYKGVHDLNAEMIRLGNLN